MTTLVRLAKRRPDLDVTTFQRAADRSCDWSSAVRHGLRAATQALTLPGGYRKEEPVYDVVDELVFDDEGSAGRCLEDPLVRPYWQSDLLDPASITTLIVEEHVAKPGQVTPTCVKNYELVTKRPGLDREEFDRYWTQVHGPLASRIPTIRRYVQAHLAPGFRDAGGARYDGLAITWFDDVQAMREGARSEAYRLTREDEHNFLDGELPFIIAVARSTFRTEPV